jgi:hypothetical protein
MGRWFFCALQKRETMARVVSEKIWSSQKVRTITPEEWQPEYSWLLPIAAADGTFEADPHLVWAQAYSCNRRKWDTEKVGRLLDELERVGLLQRARDETGKVWGRWVGSEKFLPTKERCKTNRYKTGRGDLFETSDGAAPEQRQESDGAAPAQRPLGVGVGSGVGVGEGVGNGVGVGLVCGQDSENEREQIKSVYSSPSPTATPTAAATPTPLPFKRIRTAVPVQDGPSSLDPKTACAVAEFAAELKSRNQEQK